MVMFFVYVLESIETHEHYVGYTNDLKRRLEEHNSRRNTATKHTQWRCIYYECCLVESDAKRREKYLKTSQGRRLLKRRIKDYLYQKKVN